jgi:L-iditol 2-dehydrogenase
VKAAVYNLTPFHIDVADVPTPDVTEPAGPGLPVRDVLIEVKASGICGSDLHVYRGEFDAAHRASGRALPILMGHEYAGEVARVGPGVTGVAEGDRVVAEPVVACGACRFCLMGVYLHCPHMRFLGGSHAEYIAMPANRVYRIPDGLSYEEAALIEPMAICLHAVKRFRVGIGDTVLIQGAGPIGLGTLLMAKTAGATDVIMTDVVDYRLDVARRFGADAVINNRTEDLVDRVTTFTDGRLVDVGIDAVTCQQTYEQLVYVTRPGGRIGILGVVGGGDGMLTFNARLQHLKEMEVIESRDYYNDWDATIRIVAKGIVDVAPFITHRLPLIEASRGFEIFDRKLDGAIKVLLRP